MTQLSLFGVTDKWVDSSKATPEFRPYNKVLCEWKTRFETRDEEYEPMFVKVTVRCREAILKRRIDGKQKDMFGYVVEVLEYFDGIEEEIATYDNSFLQKERKDAILDYSNVVSYLHYQRRAIAKSRVRVTQESKDMGDWFECPFCGFMDFEFFETCPGCGKRFMRLEPKE